MARAKTKAQAAAEAGRMLEELEGFEESSYVSRIETNLMSSEDRPESVDLGRLTVLVGANGAGKSRLLYALGLLLDRGAEDVMGRSEPIRQAALIAKMAPHGVKQVYARARLSQGPEDGQTWESVSSKGLPPAVPAAYAAWEDWLTPVAKVQGWLHSSSDIAVQHFAPLIAGDVTEKEIRAALPEDLRTVTGIEVPSDGVFQPVTFDLSSIAALNESLGSLDNFNKAAADALKSETAQVQALQRECDALNVEAPDEAALQAQRERVSALLLKVESLAKQEALVADVARFTELKARLAKAKEVIEAHEASRESIVAPEGEAPEAPGGNRAAKLRSLLDLIARGRAMRTEAQELGLKWCPCSGLDFEDSGVTELDRREKVARERLEEVTGSTKAYQRALAEHERRQRDYEDAINAHSERLTALCTKRDMLQTEYKSLGTRLKALQESGVNLRAEVDPEAMAKVQTKHAAEVEQLNRMTAVAALFKRAHDARVRQRKLDVLVAQSNVLISALRAAQRAVLRTALEGFCADVAAYLPDGWQFRLRLENDGGHKVCEIGLVIDGEERWMLSGAQYTIALFALTAALLDRLPCGRPPVAVFWPPGERAWSSDKLAEALRGLVKIPYQIVIPSTVMPDEVPAGVTVVALGSLPKSAPRTKAKTTTEGKGRRKKKEPLAEEGGITLQTGPAVPADNASTSAPPAPVGEDDDFADLGQPSPPAEPAKLAKPPAQAPPPEDDDFADLGGPDSSGEADLDALTGERWPPPEDFSDDDFSQIGVVAAALKPDSHPWSRGSNPPPVDGGDDDEFFDL